ncbi:Beta-barrel assembly machine subunit BamA [Nicoletella semolina]|uniref:Outer membrane protein assembly factor BamA n=1 Tax=Nicoletella semolina TaxID=271160 RepID=A0A4V2SK25_9PAST|nr:outer membrane protein assembly factor BamA [Nicoletella semolina]MDH2925378.1 outer membrane protein assembly factor BamA [Nicoletella semolina]TCP17856.1 Beta-barrel assembly machine subunit BamA [Nicoletella semolina]
MKKLLLSTLLMANGVAISAPFVVKDIRVDGIPSVSSSEALISTLPIKVGQTATDNDVANVVRQLFLQNRFEDVRAVREGNTLVIKIVPLPIIESVEIKGNSAIPKEPLTENLKANLITKGEVFDELKLEQFKNALVEHYHAIGRYDVSITPKVTRKEGSVDIKLEINEGEIAKVKKITIKGNKDFTEAQLMKLLDIQPDVPWWNIFESSKFEQNVYQQDMESLRGFYMNRGYAKFNFVATDVQFETKQDVALTYAIDEGSQYSISDIRIVGDTAKLDKELNKHLKDFKAGQLFRRDDLVAIENGIKQVLGEHGFATAQVNIHPTFDDDNHTVRINFVVEAGVRAYVRKINFEGNDVTADSTLRREMRQQEGAWLSTTAAELGKVRLERTGFYDAVEMSYPVVPNTVDQVDILYKIRERNTGSINFGIGYGTGNGFSYQAGIRQDNFLGMGSSISLNGARNDYGTNLNLGYTEPYFTKDGVSLGGNVFYEDYNSSKNKQSASYQRRTYGLNSTLGFPVDENNSYYLSSGYTHDTIKNAPREFNREIYVKSLNIPIEQKSHLYSKIKTNDFDTSFGWNYSSLNRGFLPTKGSSANIGAKITLPGSDNRYYKISADFRNYFPLNREHKWVIGSKVSLAYANGLSGKALPFYQTYAAGGIGTLRGFAYGAIGPKAIYLGEKSGKFDAMSGDVVGGNAIASATLEFITPTPFVSEKSQHNVRTSLFVDAASVWDTKWNSKPILNNTQYDYSSLENYKDYKRVRASAGVAFQWNSPIGPLVFSYAKPIKKYEKDQIEQFQFSIGGSF